MNSHIENSSKKMKFTENFNNKFEDFFLAVTNGNFNDVNNFIKKGINLECQDKFGNTALILASKNGHQEIVNILIENGAKVNTQNHDNETSLILASINGLIKKS